MGYKVRVVTFWLGAIMLSSTLVDLDHLTGARTSLHYEAGWGIILYLMLIGIYFTFSRRLS